MAQNPNRQFISAAPTNGSRHLKAGRSQRLLLNAKALMTDGLSKRWSQLWCPIALCQRQWQWLTLWSGGWQINVNVEREILNHRTLVHPHIRRFREVRRSSSITRCDMSVSSASRRGLSPTTNSQSRRQQNRHTGLGRLPHAPRCRAPAAHKSIRAQTRALGPHGGLVRYKDLGVGLEG